MVLTPTNRFVLRSASRLYIHEKDLELGHAVLRKSLATQSDPWLVAAEIAASSTLGRASNLVSTGRRMLKDGAHQALHVSELASALGTLEMVAGNARASRKLFRQSLIEPTENAIAQARWAASQMNLSDLHSSYLQRSPEALAWVSYNEGKWDQSLGESVKWLQDQRFSSRPAILASYVAAVSLENYDQSAEWARLGLVANPDDPILLNNLAYALVNLGKVEEAHALLPRIRPGGSAVVEVLHAATSGLIHYRMGDRARGRAEYLDAIRRAERARLFNLRAKASIFYALEELRAGSVDAVQAKEVAVALSRPFADADILHILSRLR